jgi:hypothetical protein
MYKPGWAKIEEQLSSREGTRWRKNNTVRNAYPAPKEKSLKIAKQPRDDYREKSMVRLAHLGNAQKGF